MIVDFQSSQERIAIALRSAIEARDVDAAKVALSQICDGGLHYEDALNQVIEAVHFFSDYKARPLDDILSFDEISKACTAHLIDLCKTRRQKRALSRDALEIFTRQPDAMLTMFILERGYFDKHSKFNNALNSAIWYDMPNAISSMIALGADLNSTGSDDMDENDPAWTTAIHPHLMHLLPLLFEAGADVNQCNHSGRNALHLIVNAWNITRESDVEAYRPVVRALFEQGLDDTATDRLNDTPYMRAMRFELPEGARLIASEIARRDALHIDLDTKRSECIAVKSPRL